MSKQKRSFLRNISAWLPNIYYVGTLISLFFILAQVFYAKQMMVQSNEWEKAKMTIENIERFQLNLSTTILFNHPKTMQYSLRLWPDFTKRENKDLGDTLRILYYSCFDEYDQTLKDIKMEEDIKKTLFVLDAFAYPIIMGYANELGSYQHISYDFISCGNYIMYMLYNQGSGTELFGHNAKLLYRLWRVRFELDIIKQDYFNRYVEFSGGVKYLLCFEGTEVTPVSIKQYERKLKKELKKIQKEIEEFRKSSMK